MLIHVLIISTTDEAKRKIPSKLNSNDLMTQFVQLKDVDDHIAEDLFLIYFIYIHHEIVVKKRIQY
jgi:hypothetical protein